MIIYLLYFFFCHSDFITSFGFCSQKIAGTFAITLRFLMSRPHVSVSGSMLENLLYVTSPQKQETDVSLVSKDSDTESENLSSLIRFSVSDSQKTDSSKDVSFIGI